MAAALHGGAAAHAPVPRVAAAEGGAAAETDRPDGAVAAGDGRGAVAAGATEAAAADHLRFVSAVAVELALSTPDPLLSPVRWYRPPPTPSPPARGDGYSAALADHVASPAAAALGDVDERQLYLGLLEPDPEYTTGVSSDHDDGGDGGVGRSHDLDLTDALFANAPNGSLLGDGWLPRMPPIQSPEPAELDWLAAAGNGGGGRDAGATTSAAGKTRDGGGHPHGAGAIDGSLPAAAAVTGDGGGGGVGPSVDQMQPVEAPRTPERDPCVTNPEGAALAAGAGRHWRRAAEQPGPTRVRSSRGRM
eukprot:TRINITY_DN7958_c0_g1_i3.p2 TRINITY_DN7958_c0_g1~~TRINITY_DN7958_c0_g1_i3.p2  ORF type:complete len:353 (+),score=72.80 TRINITY_DN7958_c0_g1_i3:147-1061(+)